MAEDGVERLLRGGHAPRRHGSIGRVDVAVAIEHARVKRLIVREAMIDPGRDGVLGLLGRRIQCRQRQERVGGRDRALREPGEERRHRLRARGALALGEAGRLARLNPANRLGARHGLGERQTDRLLQALVAAEEERLVPHNRAAERTAELVELELLFLVVVLAGGVERVVAEVVEERAVEPVAAALADDGDVATGSEAALGRRKARVDPELRNRLHRRLQPELRAGRVQIAGARVPDVAAVDAVVVQVVLLIGLAIESHAGPAAVAVARGPGRQRHQVGEVPAVDRQALDFFRGHIDAELGRLRIDHRRVSRHGDRLRDVGDGEQKIEWLDVAGADRDLAAIRGEAVELTSHFILAGREVREDVAAFGIGHRRAHGAGLARGDRDCHTREHGAARVGDPPDDSRFRLLSRDGRGSR